MVSVKTSDAIEKAKIFDALALLKGLKVTAPIEEGSVIVRDILGTGVDFVATKTVRKKQ